MDECNRCRFYEPDGYPDGKGACRRHAPKGGNPYLDGDVVMVSVWPVVSERDWCGDFEAVSNGR